MKKKIPLAAQRWICPPSKTPSTNEPPKTPSSDITWEEMKRQVGKKEPKLHEH
jgi:hypothetical protein